MTDTSETAREDITDSAPVPVEHIISELRPTVANDSRGLFSAPSKRLSFGRRRFVERYFQQLDAEYAALCGPEYRRQTSNEVMALHARNEAKPSWENNHRFEYIVLGGLSGAVLHQRIQLERERLRILAGAESATTLLAPFLQHGTADHKHDRSIALGLLSEVQRLRLVQSEFTQLRNGLTLLLLIAGALFGYFIGGQLYRDNHFLYLPPAAYSVVAGLLGGYFSVLLRLGGLRWNQEYSANYQQVDRLFSNVLPSLGLAMFEGSVAALVLYTLFLSGVVEGSIFPHFDSSNSFGSWEVAAQWLWLTPNDSNGVAKLLVWSILAGFSERLVPDLLTSFSKGVNATSANFKEAPHVRNEPPSC